MAPTGVVVFGTDRLTFTAAGTMTTTIEFSEANTGRTAAAVQGALRDRQAGAGTITVSSHASANTFTVSVALASTERRPAVGSCDMWDFLDSDNSRYGSGPLTWRWSLADTDAPEIAIDIAFGHGASEFPAEEYRPGWGFGLSADLDEAVTGYRISRLNRVRELKTRRGRPHQLAAAQAATVTIVLDDSNGFLDPDNVDAPHPYRDEDDNPTLLPGRPVRIAITPPNATDETVIFVGLIERVRQTYPGHTDEVVVLECVDTLKLLTLGSLSADQGAVTTLEDAYRAVVANGGMPRVKSGTSPYNVENSTLSRTGDSVTVNSYAAAAGTSTLSEVRRFERSTGSQLRINRTGALDILMPSTFAVHPTSYAEVSDGSAPFSTSGPALVCGLRFHGGQEEDLDDVKVSLVAPPSANDGYFTASNWTGTPLAGDNYLSVRVSKLTLTADLSSIRVRWPSGVDDNAGVALIPPNAAGDAPDWAATPYVSIRRVGYITSSLTSAETTLSSPISASSGSSVTVMVVLWHAEGAGAQHSETELRVNGSGSYYGDDLSSLWAGASVASFTWRHPSRVSPLRYNSVELIRDDDRIINRVQVGTTSLIASTGKVVSASQSAYGVRLLRVDESPLSDTEQVNWAINTVQRWAQPVTRLQSLKLKPRQIPALWEHVLGADISDAWRITRTSPAGKLRQVPALVEHVAHHAKGQEWTTILSGTAVNPLADAITTFSLTAGGTEYEVGSGENIYIHRIFTADDTVTAVGSGQVQIIAIAGGGGGSHGTNYQDNFNSAGGAGGAGGLLLSAAVDIVSTGEFDITVGRAGGADGSQSGLSSAEVKGGDSVVTVGTHTSTAVGGGRGGSNHNGGGSGGSGGGGGSPRFTSGSLTQAGGSGTSGQGHRGGSGRDGDERGGGGGGAGGVGASGLAGRTGGLGKSLNLIGTAATYAVGGQGGQGTGQGITGSHGARANTAGSGGGGFNGYGNNVSSGGGRGGLVCLRWRKDLSNLDSGDLLS